MVPVFRPQDEMELALAQSVLEAHDIPYFVHNGGFGGLYPGMQIDLYNTRTIMVPEEAAEAARELLAHFMDDDAPPPAEPAARERRSLRERLRLVAELLLGGWCVPRKPRRRDEHQ